MIVLWYPLSFSGSGTADVHFGVISHGRFSPLPAALITEPTLYSQESIAW